MNTENIISTIHSHLKTQADLQAKWEATHDAWGELADHEDEESFGDAEYAQIEVYAQQADELAGFIDRERFILQHLYCLLNAMADVVPYDIQIAYKKAEVIIPYGWQSY